MTEAQWERYVAHVASSMPSWPRSGSLIYGDYIIGWSHHDGDVALWKEGKYNPIKYGFEALFAFEEVIPACFDFFEEIGTEIFLDASP